MVAFGSSHKGADNDIALRNSMFPDAATRMWTHKPFGAFVTIPKTMPFIVRILDEITKGAPVGTVYSTLWTFTWTNDAFIKMGGREKLIAYACRFTGTRGLRTLNDRLVRLRDLGMIETESGEAGEISHIYLPNPHFALLKLLENPAVTIPKESLNAFKVRGTNQGAKDLIAMLKGMEGGGALAPVLAPPPSAAAATSTSMIFDATKVKPAGSSPPPPMPGTPAAPAAPAPVWPMPGTPSAPPIAPPGFFVGENETPPVVPTAPPPPPPPPPAPQITPEQAQAMIDALPPIPGTSS